LSKRHHTWTNLLRIGDGCTIFGSGRILPALPVSRTGCPSLLRWSSRLAVGPPPDEFFPCVFWSWHLWGVSVLLVGDCYSSWPFPWPLPARVPNPGRWVGSGCLRPRLGAK
jgi:hypothetical protein